jgi:PadR family transcriptional regulator, regulatory protein PadR
VLRADAGCCDHHQAPGIEHPARSTSTRHSAPSPSIQVRPFLLTLNMNLWEIPVVYQQGQPMASAPSDVPYGTLDLMVLKTLESLSPLHGYGIARRIEQVAQGSLALNQGTIYPALLRLEQKGWIKSTWGTSDNNRRARFYSITRAGRKQLATEADSWARTVAMVNRLLGERS